ncbi:MAG TPA: discoidin domain-containing protein [Flavobacteriales bacterium]|nr:discoidin domain-containing protein [Flavobacteriales bacterium]
MTFSSHLIPLRYTIALCLTLVATWTSAQCDTVFIDHTGWTVTYVDSEELTGEGPDNGHAIHAIDGDSTTFWHTEWQAADPPFPHEIHLDLGAVHAVNGLSLLSRHNSANGKIIGYALYLSMDGVAWGTPQAAGNLTYPDVNAPGQRATVYFGAVDARFIKLVATSNNNGTQHAMLAELQLTEYVGSGCGATGQNNQFVSVDPVPLQETNGPDITLNGTASSGLPLTWSVLSGPATVVGNTLSLTGAAGTVVVKAEQPGDATWYAASATTSFNVIDLSTYYPDVSIKLTEDFPVQMPALMPYRLYANASILHPEYLSIATVTFNVDGTTIPSEFVDGSYQAWWTPSTYGPFSVTMSAAANTGNVTDTTVSVTVSNTIADQTVATFDGDVIDMGTIGSQWFYGTYTLPQSVGAYEQIIAHFDVTCPSVPGGCDDWDRLAWIQFKAPNGQWMELIRYITPYGRACSHTVDVTDFASLLQGNIEVRMFIDTYGTGGWKLDLDLEYKAGTPTFPYTTVQEVWQGSFPFGDPANLQPMDTVSLTPSWNASACALRLVTTGHGWGDNNSGNAAEFYHAQHELQVDDAFAYQQDLWTNCSPNPDGCQPQSGTWQYDRAGWCPGTIPQPGHYDLTAYMSAAPFDLAYIFQPSYQDLCHPNNPDCISGTTCPDCGAGYNPFYRVSGYFISKGTQPISIGMAEQNANDAGTLWVYPNPADDRFQVVATGMEGPGRVRVIAATGAEVLQWRFNHANTLAARSFSSEALNAGVYTVVVESTSARQVDRLVVR